MNTLQKQIFHHHLKKSTGKLSIRKDETKKEIYFKKGLPIYVDSTARGEALGQVLLAEGVITQSQLDTVLNHMLTTGKKQGESLVELSILTAYEVYQHLERQMDRKFQNCFVIDDAEVEFIEGEEVLYNVAEFKIDIFRAILDYFSFSVDSEKLAQIPQNKLLRLNEAGHEYISSVKLLPHETKILRFFDGKLSLQNLSEMDDIDIDLAHLLVYVMHGLKLLDLNDPLVKTTHPETKPTRSNTPVAEQRNTVVIKDEQDKKNASPIYVWALKLGKPLQDILDIKPTTPRAQIQRNFDRIVKELHLDHIDSNYEDKEKPIAQSVLDRLSLCLSVFSNPENIKLYMNAQSTKNQVDVPKKILAEVHFQKAKIYLGIKDYSKAIVEVALSIEEDPKEPSYYVHLSDILLKKAIFDKVEEYPPTIIENLKKAIEINANYVDAYLEMALFYKLTKQFDKAVDCFSKCIELKPNHPQANSELRLLNKRMSEKPSGALFGGLFKKKDKEDKK